MQEPCEVWSTTVLANNIHCASCVTHIEEAVERIGQDILGVSVSIVNHEVNVLHSSSIPPSTIVHALSDEAFEVDSATTVDKYDNILSEFSPSLGPEGSFANEYSGPSWHPSCLLFPRNKRKRHVDNCVACRAQDEAQPRPIGLEAGRMAYQGNTSSIHEEKIPSGLDGYIENKDTSSGTPSPDDAHELGKNVEEQIIVKEKARNDTAKNNTNVTGERFSLEMSIGGMTCTACTSTIKDVLEKMDEIHDVNIDLMTNSAYLRYLGDEKFATTIIETIEDLGYEASVVNLNPAAPSDEVLSIEPSSEHLHRAVLSLGGMTCASCSSVITDGLKELPYVKTIDVSLMTNSGIVVFEGRQNIDSIVEKVEDRGYECSVESLEELAAKQQKSIVVGSRTVQLSIEGMFCDHCPDLIVQSLESAFHSALVVDQTPSLKKPVAILSYTPAQHLSIRNIISTIDSAHSNFKTRVYHPQSVEDRSQQLQLKERKKILLRLLLCTIVAIPTFLIGIVWMDLVPEADSMRQYFEEPMWIRNVSKAEWALFILATPVYTFAADIFHLRAVKELRALWRTSSKVPILRRFYRFGSMNLLISAGTTVAYVSSIAILIVNATAQGYAPNDTYFDSVVFLTFFILIGRYLEAYSKSKTGNAVAMLGKLRPQETLLVVSESAAPKEEDSSQATFIPPTKIQTISADLLEIGDSVIVPHGSSPPADGALVTDHGQFDESSLTGESRAVKKVGGDKVFVGTINTGNPVTIEITGLSDASMLDQIVSVVREGQTKRAPVERFADVLTGYFVPVITALAIITFFIWFALGQSGVLDSRYLDHEAGGWAFWSLEFAIAVFVVACPCGIGLAAPTALFVGGGLAAKHGILVRGGGEALQEAGSLDAIVFDKTGTLTEGGDLKVTDYEMLADDGKKEIAWTIVKSLEELSSHPIAKAIFDFASLQPRTSLRSESANEIPGLGVWGTLVLPSQSSSDATSYEAAIGSEALIHSLSPALLESNAFACQTLSTWKAQAKSVAILAIRPMTRPDPAWSIAALFATADPIRPSALSTIEALQKRKIEVYMLSGDNATTANAVASSLNIPASNVFAGVLPTEKAEKISWLQENLLAKPSARSSRFSWLINRRSGKPTTVKSSSPAKVAFVGDGINDAPALLAATVSISPSTGSPIALTSSAFVLMGSSLATIITLLDLSDRVFRRVRMNFAWALVYNVVLIPVAAGVFFKIRDDGWRLGPVWAAAAMAGSSVSVVLSSLALRWEGGWLGWRKRGMEEGDEVEGVSKVEE